MRGLTKLTLTFILVAALALVVNAETETKVSGQIRLRNEFDGRSFDTADAMQNFQLMRTRVAVEATVDGNAHAFVQFQDSRTAGGFNLFGDPQSGTLNDGKNVDIHQAYIQVDHLWPDGLGAKAGRFEFNLGNQRVFGAVGWSNVGRAWEGMQAWFANDQFKLTGFWLRALELNDLSGNRDFDIFGAHARFDRANLELFAIYEYDADNTFVVDPNDNDLDQISVGLYYYRQYQQLDFELNGVYQTGKMGDVIEVDIQALMVAGEVGYSFEGEGNARMAAGADYASGDSDVSDTDIKSYDNLYYTGHKFRGYMDYFVPSNTAGLIDLMLRGRIDPTQGWTIRGDVHYFMSAQDYLDPADTTATSDIGIEADLSIATTRVRGVKLVSGISVFLPKEAFVRSWLADPLMTESDPTMWIYNQATIDF